MQDFLRHSHVLRGCAALGLMTIQLAHASTGMVADNTAIAASATVAMATAGGHATAPFCFVPQTMCSLLGVV
ncbi:MAG: hypothetical protein ABIU38_10335 [Vicinamibacteraceae bacterium]